MEIALARPSECLQTNILSYFLPSQCIYVLFHSLTRFTGPYVHAVIQILTLPIIGDTSLNLM
ncbi:hypothetical protein Mapa_004465 [Marchantia paleacea]|nr:hypothetical protein Mapa_004465 [Marchantia paleacea]